MKIFSIAVCFVLAALSVASDNSNGRSEKARVASEHIRAYSQKLINSVQVGSRTQTSRSSSATCVTQHTGKISAIQKRNDDEMAVCCSKADENRGENLERSKSQKQRLDENALKIQNDIKKCSEVEDDPVASMSCYAQTDVETASPVRNISANANEELMRIKSTDIEIGVIEDGCIRESVKRALDDTNDEYDNMRKCISANQWGAN